MFELKKDPVVVVSFTVLAVGLLLLCGLRVITWQQALAGAGVLLAPSILGRKSDAGSSSGPPVLLVLFLLGTSCGITPKQAGGGTDAACKVVEAFSDSAAVESVCATAPELVELAAAAMAARADSGARSVRTCKIIPDTTTCATNAEMLAGIRAVRARR